MKKILLLAMMLMPFVGICQVVKKVEYVTDCKVLACPYCGETPYARNCSNPSPGKQCWIVDCQSKKECPQITNRWMPSLKSSIESWNTRVEMLLKDDDLLQETEKSGRFGEKIIRISNF